MGLFKYISGSGLISGVLIRGVHSIMKVFAQLKILPLPVVLTNTKCDCGSPEASLVEMCMIRSSKEDSLYVHDV